MVSVSFPKKLANEFARNAKAVWPIEEYAFLLGTRSGEKFLVEALWFPPDRAEYASETAVFTNAAWTRQVKMEAKEKGLEVLGDIHSHALAGAADCTPSEFDWEHGAEIYAATSGAPAVMGICIVWKTPKTMRSRIKFWPIAERVRTDIR